MRTVILTIERTGIVLARAEVAETPPARRRGLLGREGLAEGAGMLIAPCSSVHTWFMKFAIDVVFLDRDGVVVRMVEGLDAFRLASGGRRAQDTLELPAGAAAAAGLTCGDRLLVG